MKKYKGSRRNFRKMASLIGMIEPFVFGGNFSAYEDRLKQFFIINKVKNDEKTSLFITIMGAEMYELLSSLSIPKLPSSLSCQEIFKLLRAYFEPKRNKRAERYKFNQMHQENGESIGDFIVRLKAASQLCRFGDFLEDSTLDGKHKLAALDEALTDRFIIGLANEKIQQALMNDDSLDFERCCTIAQNMELSQKECQALKPFFENAVRQWPNQSGRPNRFTKNRQGQEAKSRCNRCGRWHEEEHCPAKHWQCFNCNKMGHTSTVCPESHRPSQLRHNNGLNVINSIGCSEPAIWTLLVEGQQLEMEVDTGAVASIVSKGEFEEKFKGHCLLTNCTNNFVSVTGQSIKVLGSIEVETVFAERVFVLELIIVDEQRSFRALLGRSWLDVLVPDWKKVLSEISPLQIKSAENAEESELFSSLVSEIQKIFPNVLNSDPSQTIVGSDAEVVLKENATPIFHKPYSVPYGLRDAVEAELKRLIDIGYFEPVKNSKWASPIVIVPKQDGNIRLCIDCKVTVNRFVQMEHYPLPKVEDIFASLSNSKVFCVIDLKGAYQQIKLSENSRELLTINTLMGLMRPTRLPFGLKTSAPIFQEKMDVMLEGLEDTECFMDDIIVGGKNKQQCKENLMKVLERLNSHRVHINIKKCKFLVSSVQYLGHILSEGQIKPNPAKVEAIVRAPAPKNVGQLMSYLGLLNYYGRFVPNLSSEISILYDLLKKGNDFNWDEKCQSVFEKSKQFLLKNDILELYDPKKPIIIATDGSPYGVGAVLSHMINGEEKPVLFASSSLTAAQKNYSQLHREALAIMFAVTKFHNYIYGQSFKLCTDSQALREIFNPSKGTPGVAAARLHRWAIILSTYKYEIVHRKGSQMGHADALSRLPLEEETEIETFGINFFNFSDEEFVSRKTVALETEKDVILSQVYRYVVDGWPQAKDIDTELQPFAARRNSLATEDNCLYYGNLMVIPESLKERVLCYVHENHTGIVKMKMLARSYIWWPGISENIESYVKNCKACQQTRNVPKEIVETKWPICTYPMERIHLDLFYFNGICFLILVDAYSKYIQVVVMKSYVLQSVVDRLVEVFAVLGLPSKIVTDNGPPFNAFEFQKFCDRHGILLYKIPPYHSQTNGQAERCVQTTKKVLIKYSLGKERFLTIQQKVNKFLLSSRNTPSSATGRTPSEMIFAFKPRTLLDAVTGKSAENCDLKKKDITSIENNVKKSKNLSSFEMGTRVFYRNHFKAWVKWMPAVVVQVLSNLRYLIKLSGKIRLVHRNQLRLADFSDTFYGNKIYPVPPCNDDDRTPSVPSINLRRSTRVSKKPERYGFENN